MVVSSDPSEQEEFYKICAGIKAAFRNRTRHEVSNKLTRNDAIKFCARTWSGGASHFLEVPLTPTKPLSKHTPTQAGIMNGCELPVRGSPNLRADEASLL